MTGNRIRRVSRAGAVTRIGAGLLYAVGAVVAVKVASMLVLALLASGSFADGELVGAERYATLQGVANVFEPHKAHFNRGTAQAAAGELEEARVSLRRALSVTTPDDDCVVRLNLALVLEALADRADLAEPSAGAEVRAEAQSMVGLAEDECRAGVLAPVEGRMTASAAGAQPGQDPTAPPADSAVPAPVPETPDASMDEVERRMQVGRSEQATEEEGLLDRTKSGVERSW